MTTFHDRSSGDDVELSDTSFDPKQANYSGTAYQFGRQDQTTGEVDRVGKGLADMLGKNMAADTEAKVPTGSTTDFKDPAPGARLANFQPNQHGNQMGAWN
jgi:hypothetical protein